jgi:formylglycine-generating enzyme required for sulfatase activity
MLKAHRLLKSASMAVIITSGAASLVACSEIEVPDSRAMMEAPSLEDVQRGDDCAPGVTKDFEDAPLARCAVHPEFHSKDLLNGETAGTNTATGVKTQGVRALNNAGAIAAASPPSCAAKAGPGIASCGLAGNEDCCRVGKVPAGKAGAIEVGDFDLGVFEVTAGRFAAFVEATGGNLRRAAQEGNWSGWNPEWTATLPATRGEVDTALGPACVARSNVRAFGARTWPSADTEAAVASLITDNNPRADDIRSDSRAARLYTKPINCVTYPVARAFCSWDGGRLPSNDEWAYAALGGAEQRVYPWGPARTADKLVTDLNRDANSFTFPEDFKFFGNGMNAYHIATPGKKPAGMARWGHHDMGGNVLEWVADVNGNSGIVRGGSWEGHQDRNDATYSGYLLSRSYGSLGIRCAYGQANANGPGAGIAEPAGLVKIYRGEAPGDHLLGGTDGEGQPTFVPQGVVFRILGNNVADSAPLHRCRTTGGRHFVSTDAACEGQIVEGRMGYVARNAGPGLLPLYRCHANGDHVSTVTPTECGRRGLAVEGQQGFVYAPAPSKFIRALYQAALGRDVDATGHAGWLGVVRPGGGNKGCGVERLGTVVQGVFASPEMDARGLSIPARVDALYRAALSREPDAGGRAYYIAQAQAGRSWLSLATEVTRSSEFEGLVAGRCSN